MMLFVKRLLPRQSPVNVCEEVLEFLPSRAVQPIAQLAVPVYLGPAVSPPFASSQADQEIALTFLIMYVRIVAVAAGARWVRAESSLRHERHTIADPRVVGVQMLKAVLLLVLPLKVALLVKHGIPPNVE